MERTIKESKDKLDEEDVTTIEEALKVAKEEVNTDDPEAIKAAIEKLTETTNPIITKLYQAAGEGEAGPSSDDDFTTPDGEPEIN